MDKKEDIVFTREMEKIFSEIRGSNNAGVFRDNLTDEDRRDVLSILKAEKIPVLLLYSVEGFTNDPRGSSCVYDEDFRYITVSCNCVGYYPADNLTKQFLAKIDNNDKKGPLPSFCEHYLDSGFKMLAINGYSKGIANALLAFSKTGVILDQNSLASDTMGEFFPGYCGLKIEKDIYGEKDIALSESAMRFSNKIGEYQSRKGSFGYVVFYATLIEGKETISYSDVLNKTKNEGYYRTPYSKMKDAKKYIEKAFKDEMGVDMDIIILDEEKECIMLSPAFRSLIKITE